MRDTRFVSRENYYRPRLLRPPHDRLYLKVVVEFQQVSIGKVVTAFILLKIKRSEEQKWP